MEYKSPIKIIMEQAVQSVEENAYKAVLKYDIEVDKDRLIKALAYDKSQYTDGYKAGEQDGYQTGFDEGYKAGKADGVYKEDLNVSHWHIRYMDNKPCVLICPKCGAHYGSSAISFYYCPHCGAKMDEEEGIVDRI